MTDPRAGQPIDVNGLEGHICCRLSRRRSDLFHHHALCVLQLLGEGCGLECPLQAALAIRAKGRWWCQTAQTLFACVDEDRACSVDQERAQVAVSTLGDAAQVALEAARVFAGSEANVAGEMPPRGEASNVSDEGSCSAVASS